MTHDDRFGQSAAGGPLRRHRRGPAPTVAARAALVVGWNRHPDSVAAVRFAVMLARRLDAHIHIVHIVDLDDEPLDPDAPDWDRRFAATVDEDALAARALLDTLATSWTYHSGHGSAADLLARVADEYSALLVAIGSPRGGLMSALDSLLGQSVAHRMIGQRKVPLLLVPADTEVDDPYQ
ncbi:universal stress protein [Gordonia polyisoprenivorans]|uniref:universal stress protein n=1 Tax=Gordonia polyisoprenivorans TaxID=84595 RepID=UPI0023006961|nr:universal stress protein [Gordonia polyisoprenivorans]WCB35915.1 universal stress protein [Gordonia polyisoprenivorans]